MAEPLGSVQDSELDLDEEFGVVRIALPTPFPAGATNVFLMKRDPPVLIDAGLRTDEAYEVLVAALKRHGYAVADLGGIVVTHGHRDHIGLLGLLSRESDAKICSHPLIQQAGSEARDEAAMRKQFYVSIMHEFGVPEDTEEEANSLYERFRTYSEPFAIDHAIEDGEQVFGLTAYHVPGHSPSDTLLVDESTKLTFTGDHILAKTNPNPLMRQAKPGQPRGKSLVEYQRSLHRTRGLDLGLCCPGHGAPFRNHVAVVDRILARQAKRSRQILRLVRNGEPTPYGVARRLFPDLPIQHIHQGLSIAVGHMELMEEEGIVTLTKEDGVLHCHAV